MRRAVCRLVPGLAGPLVLASCRGESLDSGVRAQETRISGHPCLLTRATAPLKLPGHNAPILE